MPQQPATATARPTSFADITALIAALHAAPSIPDEFKTALAADPAMAGQRDVLLWLGIAQRRFPPRLGAVGFAVFAGWHGTPSGNVSSQIAPCIAPWQDGSAATVQALANDAAVDVDLYDLTDAPVGNAAEGPALTEAAAAHAMAYGMMAVKPDLDLLVITTADDAASGAAASAAHVIAALLRTESDVPALAANRASLTDPLTILATLGGHESCAILGAMLAARLAGYPVLLEGLPALAAALTLAMLAGRDAAALLAHARATMIPAQLQAVFAGKLASLLAPAEIDAPCGAGLQAALLLPHLRQAVA